MLEVLKKLKTKSDLIKTMAIAGLDFEKQFEEFNNIAEELDSEEFKLKYLGGGDKLKIILVSNDNILEIQMYSYKNVEVEEDN